MKPKKIVMRAFGPYRERTECDVSLLYDSQVFLITGPTGSGKTSVLDAMCIALYGDSTGGTRGLADMRNHHAAEDEPTEVEFEFSLGRKDYRFYRSYRLHRTRGGKLDKRDEHACYEWTGEKWDLLTEGFRAVNYKACELLSFSRDQFSQVVVLPQGEFKRLLAAQSSEKAEILKVLFNTQRWERVQEKLQLRARKLKKSLEECHTRLQAVLGLGGVGNIAELNTREEELAAAAERAAAELEKALAEYKAFEEARKAAEATEALFRERDELGAKLAEHARTEEVRAREREFLDLARKAAVLAPLYEQLTAAEKGVGESKAALTQATEKAEKAARDLREAVAENERVKAEEPRLRELRETVSEMRRLLPDMESKADLETGLAECGRKIESLRAKRAETTEFIRTLDERIEKGECIRRELYEHYLEPLSEKNKRLTELHALCEGAARLISLRQKREEAAARAAAAETEAAEAEKLREAEREKAERIRAAYLQNAAVLLAAELEPGCPCPVCGAAEHPRPAAREVAEGVTARDVEAAEKAVRAAMAVSAEKRSLAAAAAETVNNLRSEEESLAAEHPEWVPAVSRIDELKGEAASLGAWLTEADEKQSLYAKYGAKLEQLQAQREEKRKEAETLQLEEQTIIARSVETETRLNEIRKRVGETDVDAFKAKLSLAEQALNEGETAAKAAGERFTQAQIAFTAADGERTFATRRLQESENAFESAQAKWQKALADAEWPQDRKPQDYFMAAAELRSRVEALEEAERGARIWRARLEELTPKLEGIERPDLSRWLAEAEEKTQALDRIKAEKFNIESERGKLREIAEQSQAIRSESERLERECAAVRRVADFVSGGGEMRINLQNFVLGLMLDEVIFEANAYFLRLSKGRYTLVREDSEGRRSLTGLDLEVHDAFYGVRRKIGTLSGGETFLASLSLAFGLAETVTAYAGGIRLDSIFIDEGFGSLDPETLDAAMSALESIRREGRLVGVISHVTELKERISSRIEVGSGTLKVLVG